MKLADGKYRTEAGSTVTLSSNGGRSLVEFDWCEEDVCIDCHVNVYPEGDFLTWSCEACGGGFAQLRRLEPVAEDGDEP